MSSRRPHKEQMLIEAKLKGNHNARWQQHHDGELYMLFSHRHCFTGTTCVRVSELRPAWIEPSA